VFTKRLDLRKLVTHTHVRTGCVYLGVKWSQVQISRRFKSCQPDHCQPDQCQPDQSYHR